MKVSDEFTVPLCRGHHRQLHQAGNEVSWWEDLQIDTLEIAKGLWKESHAKRSKAQPPEPATQNISAPEPTAQRP